MRISEIFSSIQGEGRLSGMPSTFIRTSGCNLRCAWCDTPYSSWRCEGDERTVASILASMKETSTRHCVLTGGEPMIAKGIGELARGLSLLGHHVTIETAGTVPPRGIVCDLASISPKLTNSDPGDRIGPRWRANHAKRRWNPDCVREWITNYDFQLKFVVCDEDDLGEIERYVTAVGVEVPKDRILLMPQGRSKAEIRRRSLEVVEMCRKTGYRFCGRLQIELYGRRRGV